MADMMNIQIGKNGPTFAVNDPTARAVMTGASSSNAGEQGQVPAPAAGDDKKFLRGDGTWATATANTVAATLLASGWSGGAAGWSQISTLPTSSITDAVVYDGDIFIANSSTMWCYQWDGSAWTQRGTLGNDFIAILVVWENELYGIATEGLYKWYDDGDEEYGWTAIEDSSILEVSVADGSVTNLDAVIYDDKIYALLGKTTGSNNTTELFKWDGSAWTLVSTSSIYSEYSCTAIYSNEIHLFTWDNTIDQYGGAHHYKWDGSTWSEASTLPYPFALYSANNFISIGKAVVFDNELHILGGGIDLLENVSYQKYHYKWDGSSWTSVSTLPYDFATDGVAIVYDNKIHILSGNTTHSFDSDVTGTEHYAYSAGSSPTQTITVQGMTPNSNGILGLPTSATSAQRAAASVAQLAPTAQGTNSLTITADGTVPTIDIPVQVTIL